MGLVAGLDWIRLDLNIIIDEVVRVPWTVVGSNVASDSVTSGPAELVVC